VARKKKSQTSTIQKAAALATIGMPAPVQTVAKSKLGSFLLLVGGAALLATGAISISWQGFAPKVTVNEQRAGELWQGVSTQAEGVVRRIAEERTPRDYR
jgi:hypothetical protein